MCECQHGDMHLRIRSSVTPLIQANTLIWHINLNNIPLMLCFEQDVTNKWNFEFVILSVFAENLAPFWFPRFFNSETCIFLEKSCRSGLKDQNRMSNFVMSKKETRETRQKYYTAICCCWHSKCTRASLIAQAILWERILPFIIPLSTTNSDYC